MLPASDQREMFRCDAETVVAQVVNFGRFALVFQRTFGQLAVGSLISDPVSVFGRAAVPESRIATLRTRGTLPDATACCGFIDRARK